MPLIDSPGGSTPNAQVEVPISSLIPPCKPLRRRRTLTADATNPCVAQPQCQLLSLPREIRDIIFKEAAGGMQIHLWKSPYRATKQEMFAAACLAGPEGCRGKCEFSKAAKNNWPRPIFGVMGILMSCRQMYSETIRHLYELNIFNTHVPGVIIFMPRLLLSHRMHAIRSLSFYYRADAPPILGYINSARERMVTYPDHPTRIQPRSRFRPRTMELSWVETWDTLSKLRGLVDLRVELNVRYHATDWIPEHLEMVTSVVIPERFVLVIPDVIVARMKEKIRAPNLTIIGFED